MVKNFSGQSEVTKKMLRAREVKLLWEKFWTTRLAACPEEKDLGRNQVTSFKEDISKCLNNTSRALFLKRIKEKELKTDGFSSFLLYFPGLEPATPYHHWPTYPLSLQHLQVT